MKALLIILGMQVLVSCSVQAQCKDCGCKEKCSPACQCQHDEKQKAQ